MIVLFTVDKRILLQYRVGITRHPGVEWGFFGGSIEEGETPEQTVIRETEEELSFRLTAPRFIGFNKGRVDEEQETEAHVFAAPFPGFDALEQREGSDMRLFSIEEARKLSMARPNYDILDMLEERL